MLSKYFDKIWILPLFLGQLLSLCITGTSSASSALYQRHHVNIPFTQNACMYLLLALVYGSWHYCEKAMAAYWKRQAPCTESQTSLLPHGLPQQQHGTDNLNSSTTATGNKSSYPLWPVIGFSVVDVQANVLAVVAFKNISLLSALIISSWTLPCIMLLSAQLLKTKYQPIHFLGVSLCLIGLALLIWGDTMGQAIGTGDDSLPGTNHSWLGDLVCLVSATLYAVSNVTEEYLVHRFATKDFLYRIGLAGMIQSGTLAYFFEYDILVSTHWSRHSVALVLIYVLCLFSMYSLIPTIYRLAGATFVSMNLMTSNFYSLLIGLLFLDAKMPPFYPLAYFLVIIGATVYNVSHPPVYHHQHHEYQPLIRHHIDQNDPI